MDEITIEVWVSTWKVGSECKAEITVDREEWEEMTTEERDEICFDAAQSVFEWGYKIKS